MMIYPVFIPYAGGTAAAGATATGVLTGAAAVVALGAAAYAVHSNPKAKSMARLFGAAAVLSPLLVAEDIARKMGADIPKEGVFCNSEGKSIWEIWNESAPVVAVPVQAEVVDPWVRHQQVFGH